MTRVTYISLYNEKYEKIYNEKYEKIKTNAN